MTFFLKSHGLGRHKIQNYRPRTNSTHLTQYANIKITQNVSNQPSVVQKINTKTNKISITTLLPKRYKNHVSFKVVLSSLCLHKKFFTACQVFCYIFVSTTIITNLTFDNYKFKYFFVLTT